MDQESIVYGCIKDITGVETDNARRLANRRAMLMLPTREDWSYLSQEMFSIPQVEMVRDHYQTEVIHFGASYRAIEYEWKQWMQQFEALLDTMYWVSAIVHLETELAGTHTFMWQSKSNFHVPGSGKEHIHCEWSHEATFF